MPVGSKLDIDIDDALWYAGDRQRKCSNGGNMARRSKSRYDVQCFKKFINAVKQELNLTRCNIKIEFRPYVRYNKLFVFGLHSMYSRNNHSILIDRTRNKESIANTLMHELRHVWQTNTGVMKDVSYCERIWMDRRVENIPASADFDKYYDLPWEVDARMYAATYERFIHLVVEDKPGWN